MDRLLELPAHVAIDGTVELILQGLAADAGSNEDIAFVVVAEPIVKIILIVTITKGTEEVEMKMGLRRDVLNNTGNLTYFVIFELEGLSYHICAVEIFFCGGFVDHEGMRFVEGGIGITGDHRHGEHLEKRGVDINGAVVLDPVIALFDHNVAEVVKTNH